jgi:hypothetical protein
MTGNPRGPGIELKLLSFTSLCDDGFLSSIGHFSWVFPLSVRTDLFCFFPFNRNITFSENKWLSTFNGVLAESKLVRDNIAVVNQNVRDVQ